MDHYLLQTFPKVLYARRVQRVEFL